MSIVIGLICVSLSIALIFLYIFFWNVRSGQYEDTYTPSVCILFDEKPTGPANEKKSTQPVAKKDGKKRH